MSNPNTPAPLDLAQLEDSNGTPGPWIVESHPVPKYPDLSLHTIIAPQGWQESDGSHKRTAVASELDSLADARLIAAAPALLAECRRLHCELEDAHQERVSFRDGCEDAEAELTRQREEIARLQASEARLVAVAAAVAEHFENTDAPLGIKARAALSSASEAGEVA